MIKTFGMVRKFDCTYDDGTLGEIVFKASGNLFPLYKSFTGEDLMSAYDDYVLLTQKNGKEIETKTGMSRVELNQLPIEERSKIIVKSKVKIKDDGTDFTNSVMLAMFLNGLPQHQQNEYLAAGLDCLPYRFYTDVDIIESVMQLLIQFLTSEKKK